VGKVRRDEEIITRSRVHILFEIVAEINADMATQNVSCGLRFAMVVGWPQFVGQAVSELRELARTADRDRIDQPSPFDSWFEIDVFLKITDRGYGAIPQFEINGRRIDLIVEGMKGRLAVECNGDKWHGPDQYENDMARQRDLERAGLEFWTVRGTPFYLDPDEAMESLWKLLDRKAIYPDRTEPDEHPALAKLRTVSQMGRPLPLPLHRN
jgi:hypothetical protein